MNTYSCEYGINVDPTEPDSYYPCQLNRGHDGCHIDGYGKEHPNGKWYKRHEIQQDNYIRELEERLK